MKSTLALIFAALALMIGSFIWFVVTWDREAEDPITFNAPTSPFILAQKRPPEGRLTQIPFLTHEALT